MVELEIRREEGRHIAAQEVREEKKDSDCRLL